MHQFVDLKRISIQSQSTKCFFVFNLLANCSVRSLKKYIKEGDLGQYSSDLTSHFGMSRSVERPQNNGQCFRLLHLWLLFDSHCRWYAFYSVAPPPLLGNDKPLNDTSVQETSLLSHSDLALNHSNPYTCQRIYTHITSICREELSYLHADYFRREGY